jgi:hypothetical protein
MHLYLWIYNLYVESMAMGIRRLCDEDDRTVSVVRFLGFVKKDPSVISRAAYGSLFPADTINHPALPSEVKAALRDQLIDRGYDQTVGQGVLQPRGKDLRKEIRELRQLADEIVDYATKRVAHFDKDPPKQYPGLEAIDRVIEQSSVTVQKYYLLLKAVDMDMNIYFQYDWFAPLRVTWLPDEAWLAGGFEKDVPPSADSTDQRPQS